MFGKKKSKGNRYIIAIKNYGETVRRIKDGSIPLSADRSVYLGLLDSQSIKAENQEELGKFIRESKKQAKDVRHYWEGLIEEGYTLLNVEYLGVMPAIDRLCNQNTIKFIVAV